jgi:hypothetical protein
VATAVTTTSATLNASVNPEGSATTVILAYGTDPTLTTGTTTTAEQDIGAGTNPVAVTAPLTGLTPGTTYYFLVAATNSSGPTLGAILSFTTTAQTVTPPAATSQPATAITTTTATLSASVNPEGSATTVAFVYGTDPTLTTGTASTTPLGIGAGTSAGAVTAALTGLTPGTTYYYEIEAANAGGTSVGSILSFATPAATEPAATLQFASGQFTANVTDGSAQVVLTRAGNATDTLTVVLSSPGGPGIAAFQQAITFGPNTTSMTVTLPIQNNGVPGAADVAIPLQLSFPGPGATLGASASATLVIHDNNPLPPPVNVVSLQPTTIRLTAGKGRKAKTEPGLLLQFSGALTGTGNPAVYHVLTGKTRKGATSFNKPMPFTVFNSTPTSVTLALAGKPNLSQPELLSVTAGALSDAFGRPLNGGQSFSAAFGNRVVTIERYQGPALPTALSARAVDAVFAEESDSSLRLGR